MKQVSIFIVTSARSPGKTKKAWYRYMMYCDGHHIDKKTAGSGNYRAPACIGVRHSCLKTHDKAIYDHIFYRLSLFRQWTETACFLAGKRMEAVRRERTAEFRSVAAVGGVTAFPCRLIPDGKYGTLQKS